MPTIDNLSEREIYELDRKLRKCAQLAMRPYLEIIDYRRASVGPSDIKNAVLPNLSGYFEAFDKLIEVRFPKMEDEAYEKCKDEIDFALVDMISYLKEDERNAPQMAIMAPVGFYSVVVNHCFNKGTMEKRGTRLSKGDSGAYRYHELCRIIRSTSGERTRERKRFETLCEEVTNLLNSLEEVLHNSENPEERNRNLNDNSMVRLIRNLMEYHHELIYYEEDAQIGLFLKKLLLQDAGQGKALDCVIRMYIFNEMDKILIRTGLLHALLPNALLEVNENALLKWYWESEFPRENKVETFATYLHEIEKVQTRLIQMRKEMKETLGEKVIESSNEDIAEDLDDISVCPRCFARKHDFVIIEDNETFEGLYSELEQDSMITEEVKEALISYYLDDDSLEKGSDLRHIAYVYLRAFNRCVKQDENAPPIMVDNDALLKKVVAGCKRERILRDLQKYSQFTGLRFRIERPKKKS